MTHKQFDALALKQLQSNQGTLLDDIDKLRSQGIGRYIELPQLIVCGDQSSGKSSVLEAISRVRFPTKETLCTRFATELILRRTPTAGVCVTIEPGTSRSAEERQRLRDFKCGFTTADDFPRLVDEAKAFMGTARGGSFGAFSDDVLRVEVCGPEQPHLTICDLPGLTHAAENPEDVHFVRRLVESYMSNSRSIILAIVTAKNDIENQIILDLVEKHDPGGARTLGVITKPDTLHAGSGAEIRFMSLAKNEFQNLRLGWHVLRNRDYDTRGSSDAARDEVESRFFSQGIWTNLPRGDVGIESLRSRLSKILLDQICSNLPALTSDIEKGIEECKTRLQKLGEPRNTTTDQRRYLTSIGNSFQRLISAALEGEYSDNFFDRSDSLEGWQKRLRAVVHDLNEGFANTMCQKGHRRRVIDLEPTAIGKLPSPFAGGSGESEYISRPALISEIREEARRSRGKELPGFPNARLVGKLFRDQSKPWEDIASDHLKSVWTAVKWFLRAALRYLTNENTFNNISRELIDPWLNEKYDSVQQMLGTLLKPHKQGYPITYDPEFSTSYRDHRTRRQKLELRTKLDSKKQSSLPETVQGYTWQEVQAAVFSDECMDPYASSSIIESLEAYYKIAMRLFIDNVAILVIENCLIDSLADIFSPDIVSGMDDDLLERLAAEPETTRADRVLLKAKLEALLLGLRTCSYYTVPASEGTVGTDRSLNETPAPVAPFIFGPPPSSDTANVNKSATASVGGASPRIFGISSSTTPVPSKTGGFSFGESPFGTGGGLSPGGHLFGTSRVSDFGPGDEAGKEASPSTSAKRSRGLFDSLARESSPADPDKGKSPEGTSRQ